jgi:hypothetical protein
MSSTEPLPVPQHPRSRRRARVRRAGVALASGLGIFLALQGGLILLLDDLRPALRDPFYLSRQLCLRRRVLKADPKPASVVMLGSSRAQFGLRAGLLEQELARELARPVVVFNFAKPGAGSVMTLFNWQRLRRDGLRPDLLLVEVHPALLGENDNNDLDEAVLPTPQVRRRHLPILKRYEAANRPRLLWDWWVAYAVPCYSLRLNLVSWACPQLLPWQFRQLPGTMENDSGDIPEATEWLDEDRPRRLSATFKEYNPLLTGFRLGRRPCAALRELVAACRSDGTAVALVVLPEGEVFRGWYPPGAWEAVRAHLDALGREFGVPVVDAREWVAEKDFYDSHHLKRAGAEQFTRRLEKETVLPVLRGRAPVDTGARVRPGVAALPENAAARSR